MKGAGRNLLLLVCCCCGQTGHCIQIALRTPSNILLGSLPPPKREILRSVGSELSNSSARGRDCAPQSKLHRTCRDNTAQRPATRLHASVRREAQTVVANTCTKQTCALRCVNVTPSVAFAAELPECSHCHVDVPNQRYIRDVLVALSATLAIALAKSGSTFTRMHVSISASALPHRRSLSSLVDRAPAQ